ncbi:MAG: FkbM family methyltransferase [Nanoarchaeota archaeon]
MDLKNRLRLFIFNLLGQENVNKLRYMKFKYKFNKFLRYQDKNIFVKKFSKFYEPEMAVIPKIVHNPEVIIDIGANYGPYSFFLSKLYPEARIFAFEPAKSSYYILKRITKEFNLSNVTLLKKGLGAKEEKKDIITPLQYTILAYVSGKNIQKSSKDSVEEIEITTLDKFFVRNKISKIDFIKCDVEGFELEVFKGAKKTIRKFKPLILVEIEERHTKKYGINPDKVMKFFKGLGYNYYSLKNENVEKTDKITKEIPLYLFAHKKVKITSS